MPLKYGQRKYRMQKMAAAHRRSMLRVACCCRTVSYTATAVVLGIPPIHLLTEERAAIGGGVGTEEARAQLLAKWQRTWEVAEKGR